MNNYLPEYQSKLISAEEAVKVVKSGDWVDYGISIAYPAMLDRALAGRASELSDVNIRNLLSLVPLHVNQANVDEGRPVFTINSFYYSGIDRAAAKIGAYFHIPMRFSEMPLLYRRDIERVDVAFLTVCPPDKFGYCNFGPTASVAMEACRKAKVVILEVNPNMPYALGIYDECIHISEADWIVESNEPIPMLSAKEPNEVERKIAEYVIEDIVSGSCIQLGIGGLPNAIGAMLVESDLTDLGIHTEMYVDSMMELTLRGKVTGRQKKTDVGKQVYTFAAGSKDLYAFIDRNPVLRVAPVDYVNDPDVVARNDRFIAINNAIEIDLFGQVNAESSEGRHISGTGGQLDFVIGASHSRGGKSFTCLSSTFTDRSGTVHSRIVPALLRGSIVTDPRTTTQIVVTEYGKVNLKGLSSWQRAEGLIGIAHPDFRDGLIREAEALGIWRKR